MEKRIVFRFSFFDLKNENEKTNRFSFILLNFLHVKCNCGTVHAPGVSESPYKKGWSLVGAWTGTLKNPT